MRTGADPWGFPKPLLDPTGVRLLEAFAFQSFTLQLPGAAYGFRGFASSAFGRLFVVPPQLHLAKNSLPLHLLFERFERLVDIVVTHEDLHLAACSFPRRARRSGAQKDPSAGIPPRGLAL